MMKNNDKILMEEGLKDVPRKIQDNLETNASNISENIFSNNNLMKKHISKKREKYEESYFSSGSGINIFNISYFKTICIYMLEMEGQRDFPFEMLGKTPIP